MAETMRAVILHKYGPPNVLEIGTVDRPKPQKNEILVKIHAAGINRGDTKRRAGELGFIVSARYPAILGYDLAGEVVACGPEANRFRPGDAVYGMRSVPRGGTYAEYVTLPETWVARKPPNLSFEEAAAIPLAASTALQALRDKGQIKPDSTVLVNGASGGVGTFAVQIAHSLGATVTGVCSGRNVDLVRQLGAEEVIDYQQQDPNQSGKLFDIIFDTVGSLTLKTCRRSLKPTGIFIRIVPSPETFIDSFLSGLRRGPKAATLLVQPKGEDLTILSEMASAGQLKPVIDRTFPFTEAVAAHEYMQSGRASGKVVFTNPWL